MENPTYSALQNGPSGQAGGRLIRLHISFLHATIKIRQIWIRIILEILNELSKVYTPLLSAIDVVLGLFIGIALFWVAHRANNIAESNIELASQESQSRKYRISKDERELFHTVYSLLTEALGLVMKEGRVKGEAHAIFWQARDRARLELPEDIQEYTQVIFKKMHEAYLLGGVLNHLSQMTVATS